MWCAVKVLVLKNFPNRLLEDTFSEGNWKIKFVSRITQPGGRKIFWELHPDLLDSIIFHHSLIYYNYFLLFFLSWIQHRYVEFNIGMLTLWIGESVSPSFLLAIDLSLITRKGWHKKSPCWFILTEMLFSWLMPYDYGTTEQELK